MKKYFKIIKTVYQAPTEHRLVIKTIRGAQIHLIETNEGFIVDVYNEQTNEPINTMAIWDEDIDTITTEEIREFKKEWGQTHGEITSCLGFPKSHNESDELILETGNYFWVEKDKRWYNRCASGFTTRDQQIADYLRNYC